MSARNYLSAREKSNIRGDCLPYINHQKFARRSEVPVLSANEYNLVNRNLIYSYNHHFAGDSLERSGTPFSDFFSESETGTPDFQSEESDSSAGSVLKRNTAEATKTLADEWDRIERTLYDEDGEKCMRPQIIEECKQWQQLHPQLRVIGKGLPTPDRRLHYRQIEHEEIIAMHYSDYEQFSESEERQSQSSTDVTPTNSPRASLEDMHNTKLSREKTSYSTYGPDIDVSDTFSSLLHITPIQIRSPSHKKKQSQSILRSDIASSKWMKTHRPDSSINFGRNSAKSYISLDTKNLCNLNSVEQKKNNNRVFTARLRDMSHLQPLNSPDIQHGISKYQNGMQPQYNIRKVSLPPLLLEEEKKKVSFGSAKKQTKYRKNNKMHHFDKYKHS
ncbi:uncharacterized protein LOC123693068 isoform X1 [Colias croceus]|uniref:uncharacterized protein LOC123693068 isoform X1 n=1 Tax=Colias crocea TaxID=72248 RepID=UPI001E27AEDF|nr:uncharacterized protein LOC123693068 isoform X1 [Colias croceus]